MITIILLLLVLDVALRLLKDYPNLVAEVIENVNENVPGESRKVSVLVALAKLHSSFPSGSGFGGLLQQFIYDNLIVGKEFQNNYGIPESNIAKFVSSGTFGDDRNLHTSSSAKRWSVAGFDIPLEKLLDFEYRLVLFFKSQNIVGTREIYDEKYAHYEVLGILKHFSQNIGKFSYEQLIKASAHEAMLYAAENGIVEFVNAMREANPDLLSVTDNNGRGIFWYAIQNRRLKVFQLIYFLKGLEKEMFRYRTDVLGNNLLHTAALLVSSSNRNGRLSPAMHIQTEIQWFTVY
ncbi:hypothetical protein MTR_5g028830 [Medicago truncatula]|uniref:Ankyrin repeat-containing domain-containing protein n=1 Tax=Medicago truncatula TaxID=3880 RepID=G7KB02_MEDTR|nr:hypothetical protein MTR_5g028830 [Medicago truncatula]